MHRGGGYYCVHIAACALCLSLDGSIYSPKEVGGRPSKGECKKKGVGMRGIKMGEGYYSPTPILLQVFCEIVLFVTII